MARLNSSLSVRISETLRFHAWYEAATSSAAQQRLGREQGVLGIGLVSGRPVVVGASPIVVQVSQRSSRACAGASAQRQVSRIQPAFADPATSGSTASTAAAGSANATWVVDRRPSRPS